MKHYFFLLLLCSLNFTVQAELPEKDPVPTKAAEKIPLTSELDNKSTTPVIQAGEHVQIDSLATGNLDTEVRSSSETVSPAEENITRQPETDQKVIAIPSQEPTQQSPTSEQVAKTQIVQAGKKSQQSFSDQELILKYIEDLMYLNQTLPKTESENEIDLLLEKKTNILNQLIALLGKTRIDELPIFEDREQIQFLNSRIAINETRGNDLAVQRDKAKLAYFKIKREILEYLQYLIDASRSYTVVDEIVDESVSRLNAVRSEMKQYKLPRGDDSSKVYTELKKNYTDLKLVFDTYQDILSFVIANPGKVVTTHWFQKISLLSSIAFFNNFEVFRTANHKLAPLRIDMGGIIVSLLIVMLVVFWYPLAVKGISWLVERYFLQGENEHTEEIYHSLKKPIFTLIVVFSLDLASYALFYKTEYKSSLENVFFVIYTVIYLWILFKILDSIVVVQLDKFSKSSRQLRKELVNLGIKATKGLFMIIGLSVLLNRFGISIAALMSTLGIGGLAFALAAKDSLSNLLGGVTLLIDNVFSIGDWIEIGDVEGTAVQIGLRSTTIRTFDNALITIPNSLISVSSVKNWNRRAIGRRIKMYVGVTYESDMNDIRQAVEDIRTMLIEHPDIANPKEQFVGDKRKQFRLTSREDMQGIKSTLLVFVDRYNEFSIDILIYCFSRTVNWAEWLAVKEDVLYKIADILKQNNLEFAYPTAVRIFRPDQENDLDVIPDILGQQRLT